MKTRTRLILLALLLIAFWGGRSIWHHVQTPDGTTPARIYRLGRVVFRPCTLDQPQSGLATRAWCAPFHVPENWARPDGRQIALRLALIRSTASHPAPDPVLYLAGGPGQSAIDTWPVLEPALHGLLANRNVILLDQRGTGGSTPLTCPRSRTGRSARAAPASDSGTSSHERLTRLKAETRACLAALEKRGLNPADFTTTQAVRDLGALRQALGDPKFDLVGVSYGTLVAEEFMKRYPQAVRSAILDSVVPDQLIVGQNFGVNLDQALHADFALCTQNAACRKAFGNSWTTLVELKRRLARHAPWVRFRTAGDFQSVREALTPNRLVELVRFYAYSSATAALLPLVLHAASEGHYAPLLAQSRFMSQSVTQSLYGDVQLSVLCSEDVPWLHATPAETASLLGNTPIEELHAVCAIWPQGAVPTDFHAPLRSSIPTLILEGELDPVTPPRYGSRVLRGLSDARLLIAPGQGHNVIGIGCMPHLVQRFIKRPDPSRLDASCLSRLGPMPPFLNYNRGAP